MHSGETRFAAGPSQQGLLRSDRLARFRGNASDRVPVIKVRAVTPGVGHNIEDRTLL